MDSFVKSMIARGPTLDTRRETATGSLHVLGLSGVEAAREFVALEPNNLAGVYAEHLVWRFENLLGRSMWEFPGQAAEPRFLVIGRSHLQRCVPAGSLPADLLGRMERSPRSMTVSRPGSRWPFRRRIGTLSMRSWRTSRQGLARCPRSRSTTGSSAVVAERRPLRRSRQTYLTNARAGWTPSRAANDCMRSVGRLETGEHREVAHVRRQQIGFEEESGCGDQVVGVVDPAVGSTVLASKLLGRASDIFADRDPGDRREELLERRELVVSDFRHQLEPNDLAGGEGLVVLDETFQEVDCSPVASEMVDGNRRVEQLHSSPRRLRRSLRSPRTESTYSLPVKPRPRHEPALVSSARSLSAFVGCPKVLRTARRTSSDREAPVARATRSRSSSSSLPR